MNPVDKASLKLQACIAERPFASDVVRQHVARGEDTSAILPFIPLIIQALLGMISGCYPDSGILAWIRRQFGFTRYTRMRAKILSADRRDRLQAASVVHDVLERHGVTEESLGVNNIEITDDAISVVRGMTEAEFAELARSLER